MRYEHESEIQIQGSNVGIIYRSLKIESAREIPKTSVTLNLNHDVLNIKIKATNLSSLRAALNSYLRWINLAVNLMEI